MTGTLNNTLEAVNPDPPADVFKNVDDRLFGR